MVWGVWGSGRVTEMSSKVSNRLKNERNVKVSQHFYRGLYLAAIKCQQNITTTNDSFFSKQNMDHYALALYEVKRSLTR